MSLSAKVQAILARARAAARPADDPARPVPGGTAADRLAAMLAEVEDAVLPRALHFAARDGSRLTVEARGRRLARVTAAEGPAAPAGWAEALAAAEADPAAEAAQMARLLIAFAEAGEGATVAAAPSDLPASFVRPGQPVPALAEAIRAAGGEVGAVVEPAPTGAPGMAGGDLPPGLFAALDAAGDPVARADDIGKVTRSANDGQGLAARVAPAAARLADVAAGFGGGALAGPRLVFLASRGGALPAICHAAEGAERVTGAPGAAALDPLADAWRRGLPGNRAAE